MPWSGSQHELRVRPGCRRFTRYMRPRRSWSTRSPHSALRSPGPVRKPKVFLSAVSGQFRDCRNALASDLRAIGAEVVVQEDFKQHGWTLLEKLQEYIAGCDRVIALVGDAYGFELSEESRHPDHPR